MSFLSSINKTEVFSSQCYICIIDYMALAWLAVVELLLSFTLAYSRISHEYSSLFIIVINLI